jgi:DNA repair ATPase RecN
MPDGTSSSGISNAYSTFAEILSKQNEVIDKFNELTNLINSMDKRLTTVENRINNISTIHNVNKLHSEIIKVEQTVDDKIESIKEEILDLLPLPYHKKALEMYLEDLK